MSQFVGAVHIKVNDSSVWNRFSNIDEDILTTLGITWDVNIVLIYKARDIIATNNPIDFSRFSDHHKPRRACDTPRNRGRVGQR